MTLALREMERLAWERFAKDWDGAVDVGGPFRWQSQSRRQGICGQICYDLVPHEVRQRMRAKVKTLAKKRHRVGTFIWGWTKRGAKKRAEFCRAQARELA